MRFLLKLLLIACAVSFFLLVMTDPKGAADLLVNLGLSAAWVAEQIGSFWVFLMEKLKEIRS